MKSPKFLIVITGWNWQDYVSSCILSVLAQTYKNFKIVIVDDGSTDNSANKLKNAADIINKSIIDIFFGKKNHGTIFARDYAITNSADDYDIIAFLDGDDQLYPYALEKVVEQYRKGKWMTYGNWINKDHLVCSMPLLYEKAIHEKRDYRKDTFRCTHFRTFRKELYFAIPEWNPTKSEIESYPDVEILMSMMEMCGEEKIGVIYQPLYIYNETNPLRTLKRFGKDDEGYAEICSRPKRELIMI